MWNAWYLILVQVHFGWGCAGLQLKGECNDLKHYIKELQLAEHGLDARSATDYSSLCSLLPYLASSLRTDIHLVNA